MRPKVTELKAVELSDKVIITVQDDTSNEVADMLTQNMNSTMDKIVRNMLVATASQIAAANGVNGGVPTEINQTDIDLAIDYLEGNNAVKFTPVIEGKDKFGKMCAESKSSLIDLEAYGESYGDRAQAGLFALAA